MDDDSQADQWVSIGTPEWTRENHKQYLLTALTRGEHELDNLTTVVAGSTLLEYYLRRLIALKLNVEMLEPSDGNSFEFSALVRLAQALDLLPDSIKKPLKAVMALRNKYAHQIAYQLQESDIKKLRKAVSDTWMEEDWEQLEAGPPDQLSPPDRTLGFQLRAAFVCIADALFDYIDYRSGNRSAGEIIRDGFEDSTADLGE